MFIFLPLTCVYYPVSTLPAWLQPIAWALPPTSVFEGMRALVLEHTFRTDLMVWAFALNVLWIVAASVAFTMLLNCRTARRLAYPGRRMRAGHCSAGLRNPLTA